MSQSSRDQRKQLASRQRALQNEVQLLLRKSTNLPDEEASRYRAPLQEDVRLLLRKNTNSPNMKEAVRDATQSFKTAQAQRVCEIGRLQPPSSLTHLSACLDPHSLDDSLRVSWGGHKITVDEYLALPTRPLCLRERQQGVIEALQRRNVAQYFSTQAQEDTQHTGASKIDLRILLPEKCVPVLSKLAKI
jgi:hypothetical protein